MERPPGDSNLWEINLRHESFGNAVASDAVFLSCWFNCFRTQMTIGVVDKNIRKERRTGENRRIQSRVDFFFSHLFHYCWTSEVIIIMTVICCCCSWCVPQRFSQQKLVTGCLVWVGRVRGKEPYEEWVTWIENSRDTDLQVKRRENSHIVTWWGGEESFCDRMRRFTLFFLELPSLLKSPVSWLPSFLLYARIRWEWLWSPWWCRR